MPTTKLQKIFYAFLTVLITVHLFVFYNLSIEMGGMSNQVFLASIKVVSIEFFFAIILELLIVEPLAEKLAFKMVNPREDKPIFVTLAIICSTISYMCPMMSLILTILFHGSTSELIAQWMQNIVINLPFAFFSQIFFVQLLVRFIFGLVFKPQQTNQEEYSISEAL